jgi:hypothetical protein
LDLLLPSQQYPTPHPDHIQIYLLVQFVSRLPSDDSEALALESGSNRAVSSLASTRQYTEAVIRMVCQRTDTISMDRGGLTSDLQLVKFALVPLSKWIFWKFAYRMSAQPLSEEEMGRPIASCRQEKKSESKSNPRQKCEQRY